PSLRSWESSLSALPTSLLLASTCAALTARGRTPLTARSNDTRLLSSPNWMARSGWGEPSSWGGSKWQGGWGAARGPAGRGGEPLEVAGGLGIAPLPAEVEEVAIAIGQLAQELGVAAPLEDERLRLLVRRGCGADARVEPVVREHRAGDVAVGHVGPRAHLL